MTAASRDRRVEAALGSRPNRRQPVGGGWASVSRVTLADGRTVAEKAGDGLALEGRMLRYLADNSALPVPGVYVADDDLLVMDWLESGGGLGREEQRDAARHVAALHGVTADAHGLSFDTLIGPLHQPNPKTRRWIPFFRDHRLLYMAGEAYRAGRIDTGLMARIESFASKLDGLIDEPAAPALLHGDLWGGNVLAGRGRIAGFIDPAIYHGHPEIELAFSTLFSTFGDGFFDRYQELRGLDAHWRRGFFESRRDIYNLYPLLVHARLFGGGYASSVDRIVRRFGA